MTKLDFALVGELEPPTVWFALPTALQDNLTRLPDVDARAQAAVHFAHRIRVHRDQLAVVENRETTTREAYLRAALAEFGSLDEAGARDFARLGLNQPPKQAATGNPLFVAFRLLRHLNVHLSRSTFTKSSKPARIEFGGSIHEVEFAIWLVDDYSVEALMTLRDSKRYSAEDLSRLADWFNSAQGEWGAPHLLRLATMRYCEKLLEILPRAV